jgi:hypothetical protein
MFNRVGYATDDADGAGVLTLSSPRCSSVLRRVGYATAGADGDGVLTLSSPL